MIEKNGTKVRVKHNFSERSVYISPLSQFQSYMNMGFLAWRLKGKHNTWSQTDNEFLVRSLKSKL